MMKRKSVVSLLLALMIVVAIVPSYASADPVPGPVSIALGETNTENGITAWSGDGPGGVVKETVQGKSGWRTDPAGGEKYIYLNVQDAFINGGTNAVTVAFEYYDSADIANNTFGFSYDSVSNAWDYNVPKTYLTGSNTWKTVTYSLKDANLANRENGADIRIDTSVPILFGSVTVGKSAATSVATGVQAVPASVSLPIGTTRTIAAAVTDQNGYLMNKLAVSYSSSNTSVATVDSTGKITALQAGTAVVTAKNGALAKTVPVTVTPFTGPATAILGAAVQENGLTPFAGDTNAKTIQTYSGITGWQTNPAASAHYIYFKVSDNYIYGGKNKVKVTVDYYDSAVTGEKGFKLAYDSTLTQYAYTDLTLLKGSNTWKQATYIVDDAQFGNRLNNGADFRIETSVPICFSKVEVELIPTVSMRGAQVKTGSVFKETEASAVNLVFDNQFNSGRTLDVTYNLLDDANAVVGDGAFQVSLNPMQKGFVKPLNFGILDKGTYTVSVDAVNADGTIKLHENIHIGTIADLTGKPVHSFLGLNTHFSKAYGGSDVRLPLAVQTGAVSIRDGYVAGNPTTYIDNATANGLSTFIVTSTDPVAIQQTVTSLQGKVNAFEIGNELSTQLTPAQYLAILQNAYTTIKGVNPSMKVVGGVTLNYDEPWLKQLVDLGATQYLDAMSFHVYPSHNPEKGGTIAEFQDLKDYIQAYQTNHGLTKEIELWLTEIGWPTMDQKWGGVTEIDSASYAAQLYVTNLANDTLIDKIYWYDFLNDCTDGTFYECSQGLLYVDNSPKPSFVGLNAVSDLLGGASFVQAYSLADGDVRAYKFHRASDNQDIVVLWSNVDKQIGLHTGSAQVVLTDLFGNARSFDTIDGTTTFTISEAPVYLIGNFAAAPVLDTPTYTANASVVTAAPGEEVQITVTRAGGAQSLSGTYESVLPLGWQLVSGSAYSSGSATDVLTVRAPETSSDGIARINPIGSAGERYGSLTLEFRMKEAVVVHASPVVNAAGDGWDLAVTIDNQNSLATMSGGTVTVLEPASMAGTFAFGPIAPNSGATVAIPASSLSKDTPLPVKVRVDRDDGFSQLIERNMSALTAVKANQPIVIDGVLGSAEWSHAESFALDQASQVRLMSDWGGTADLSADAYTKWDAEHLYLAVRVTDNTHLNNNPPGDSWKGDSIQFAIDPGRSIEPGKLGWSENSIALNSETNAVMKRGGIGGNNLQNSSVAVHREGTQTVYEMAIDWSDILPAGMTPSAANAIGFSFLVNDNDGTGRRGWMEYMSGIGLSKNPELFGDLILTDRTNVGADISEPASIAVDPAAVALPVGGTASVTAAVYDQNNAAMSGVQIAWSSSDPAVAAVDATGTITAVSAGTSVVQAAYGGLTANVAVTVQAVVLISDTFGGSNGSTLAGRSPDAANLPGGTWTLLNFPSNGNFSAFVNTGSGAPAPQAQMNAGGNAKGAIAIPLGSAGTYAKPARLRIEADLSFPVKAYEHVGLGFYAALPSWSGGDIVETSFTGLSIDNRTGAITLKVNGQSVGSSIAYTGAWNPESGFLHLAYTVNTASGAISDVTFTGSTSDYSFATAGFTNNATAYAAALIGSTFQRDHRVYVDNFKVSGV
ncbi:sugar-binding protein [Cohnella sp. GCM10012308]|uniref:sugar-binding protein n=1 Tax=Cohnella sp. GCM10012308 TaxID=3317329 RepID=UPI00360E01F2